MYFGLKVIYHISLESLKITIFFSVFVLSLLYCAYGLWSILMKSLKTFDARNSYYETRTRSWQPFGIEIAEHNSMYQIAWLDSRQWHVEISQTNHFFTFSSLRTFQVWILKLLPLYAVQRKVSRETLEVASWNCKTSKWENKKQKTTEGF